MQKFKWIAYIVLIIVTISLTIFIYNKTNENNYKKEETEKEKSLSEIKFLESKIINLLNTLNNIESKNYDISIGEISQKNSEESSKSSESENKNSSEESNSSQGNSEGEQSDSNSSSDNKKFELNFQGVLANTKDINWDSIKSEVENLYTSIPVITIDLYQLNNNEEDILNFNKEFDNLAIVVKNQNKEETLAELSKIYDYFPIFIENATNDEVYKTIVKTKSDIIKSYVILDSNNWVEIGNNIKSAITTYSELLSNSNIEENRQYSINKGYVMLNELQNAFNIEDKEIFLIKYKNLLEEINSI